MRELFRTIERRTAAGEDLVLVTVIASVGSTPRGAGASMLVGREGCLWGTIGGGAVEHRAEQLAREVLEEGTPACHEFTLTRGDSHNLGMICGGSVQVFFHCIPGGDAGAIRLARRVGELLERGENLWLISDIGAGGVMGTYTAAEGFVDIDAPAWLAETLGRRPLRTVREGRDLFCQQIGSASRVYIFGCGHVARELEPVLSHLGFRCVMLDDRPEYARRELFPTAEDVRLIDFERVAECVDIGREDYVCVMTRGHASDTTIQAHVLRRQPCYMGVIGSRQKAAGVQKALRENHGIREEELKLITTPIGLEIQAETPAEIAISIAAQMIAVRAGGPAR